MYCRYSKTFGNDCSKLFPVTIDQSYASAFRNFSPFPHTEQLKL